MTDAATRSEIKEAFELKVEDPPKQDPPQEKRPLVIPTYTNAISLAKELLKGYINTLVKTHQKCEDETAAKRYKILVDKDDNLIVKFPCSQQESYRFFEKYRDASTDAKDLLHFEVKDDGVHEYYRRHTKRGWVNGVNLCLTKGAEGRIPTLDELYTYMNIELHMIDAGQGATFRSEVVQKQAYGVAAIAERFYKLFRIPVLLINANSSKEERVRFVLEAGREGIKQMPIILERVSKTSHLLLSKDTSKVSQTISFRYVSDVYKWLGRKRIDWAGKDTTVK